MLARLMTVKYAMRSLNILQEPSTPLTKEMRKKNSDAGSLTSVKCVHCYPNITS